MTLVLRGYVGAVMPTRGLPGRLRFFVAVAVRATLVRVHRYAATLTRVGAEV